jgi:hypothetical protein
MPTVQNAIGTFEQLQNMINNKLTKIKLDYPQKDAGFEHNFCNENVYGNLSLITIHGFLKLDPAGITHTMESKPVVTSDSEE